VAVRMCCNQALVDQVYEGCGCSGEQGPCDGEIVYQHGPTMDIDACLHWKQHLEPPMKNYVEGFGCSHATWPSLTPSGHLLVVFAVTYSYSL
jgi:hypothetical protein